MMQFSIIIPTCNRNDLLKLCLDRIQPGVQKAEGFSYEVIVTDDSVNNNAKSFIEQQYSWVRWIEGPKRGPAANRNNGAKHTSGEWLIFIDDDVLPDAGLFWNYYRAIQKHPDEQVFEGAILPDSWDLLKKDMAECPINTNGNAFWSANIAVKKHLFEKVNGFNENYIMAAQEDQQLKIDIERVVSKPIIFLKDCIVIHPVRFTTVGKQIAKIGKASKNFSIYVVNNKDTLKYRSLLNFGVKQFVLHGSNTLNQLRKRKIKSTLVALVWLLYGVPLNIINVGKLNNARS